MRPFHSLAVLGVFCSVLTACEATDDLNPFYGPKVVLPACPTVRFLRDADKVTVYRPGSGRDITDILYEAKLEGFVGDCEYVGDGGYRAFSSLDLLGDDARSRCTRFYATRHYVGRA